VDRKPATRRRESSGELDDDREELVRAIQSAVNFSGEKMSTFLQEFLDLARVSRVY
jgi:hypothetical protein